MIKYFKTLINSLQGKSTKIYLVLANIILVIFAIWFSNIGLLPFSNTGDFLFFAVLGLIFAIYRPGWAFVFLIGSIALENINIAPRNIGLAIRPYQLLSVLIAIALIVRFVMKKMAFSFPKFKWYDALLIIFALGGFLSSIIAENKMISFKQSIIALSFVVLYFLVRIYIQSADDFKRVAPFFLGGAIIITLYGILQNLIFIHGGNSFEVMPGRPNATFAEPDWLGVYLTFLLATIFTSIFYQNKKVLISNFQFPISNKFSITQIFNYLFLTLIFVGLILTVSRSAWLGAAMVTILFIAISLFYNWKNFWKSIMLVFLTGVASLTIIYFFNLTSFQLFNRAASTGGLQKITIACQGGIDNVVPQKIGNIEELTQYNCRHINLEDINQERDLGYEIREIYRNDPNINIRAEIYKKSWQQIKQYPILGVGWGNIIAILGTDERGAGLNASNIFLEVWLGTGLIGVLAFMTLLVYIFVRGAIMFLNRKIENKTAAAFILLGWTAIVIPNLFNSGIFLGFIWIYLAVAIGLLAEKDVL